MSPEAQMYWNALVSFPALASASPPKLGPDHKVQLLSRPSSDSPMEIANSYLASHASDLGLTVDDVGTLVLGRQFYAEGLGTSESNLGFRPSLISPGLAELFFAERSRDKFHCDPTANHRDRTYPGTRLRRASAMASPNPKILLTHGMSASP
jgi:hypothetical protein